VSASIKQAVTLVASIVCLAACVNYSYPPDEVAPLPNRADGLQNIEIVREKKLPGDGADWTSWLYVVTVNDTNVYGLKNGERVSFGLEPGTYRVGVRCEVGDLISNRWIHRDLEVEIVDGTKLLRFHVGAPWRAGGCFITQEPPGFLEGVESVQIIPVKIRRLDDLKNPNHITLTVNGADFSRIRRSRFGLESGKHTIGVRCQTWDEPSEPYYDEITVNVEPDAPMIKLYAGRNDFQSPPCFIGTEK
jgi:hypothetical protein